MGEQRNTIFLDDDKHHHYIFSTKALTSWDHTLYYKDAIRAKQRGFSKQLHEMLMTEIKQDLRAQRHGVDSLKVFDASDKGTLYLSRFVVRGRMRRAKRKEKGGGRRGR